MMDGFKVAGALATGAAAIPGSITVATITGPASGIAGVLGLTATTTVVVPVGAVVAVGAALSVGAVMGYKHFVK